MYKDTIIAFTKLLKEQPSIINSTQRAELKEIISDLTDLTELSNAISEWCEKRSDIDKLLDSTIEQVQIHRSIGGGEIPIEEDAEILKDLINTIHTSVQTDESQTKESSSK